MDAMLWELLAEGSPDDRVEVLIKLSDLVKVPSDNIEIVAQIGNIASCRIRRGDIEMVRGLEGVLSMKASRTLSIDLPYAEDQIDGLDKATFSPKSRNQRLPFTGKNVAVGIADWGIDFTHPNFINANKSSRFIAIWHQGADYDGKNAYGYGTIYDKTAINDALDSNLPFQSLGYHPGLTDTFHQGMHGTHVLDIAAGNGSVGEVGIVPNADLIAVHLATNKFKDLMGLGDSVRVFDAIHFLDAQASEQPLVINMSVGSHGDAHAGLSLIEQAIDSLATSKPNRAIVQSCGNYFKNRTHTKGILTEGRTTTLEWLISEQDKTPNEIEIWYAPADRVKVAIQSPNGDILLQNQGVGRSNILNENDEIIGRYYHRAKEPNTQLNQILIILDTNAQAGKWQIILHAKEISEGRYEAWVERDVRGREHQSRFSLSQANPNTTTGSICNGFHTICVGAYDDNDADNKIGLFSSVGPTWDGREKPDLVAPGVNIHAAKSASPYQNRSTGELTVKTGTSMAAPYVSGAVALIYEASNSPLSINEVKEVLFKACELPSVDNSNDITRYGKGVFNVERLFFIPANPPTNLTIKNNNMDAPYFDIDNFSTETFEEAHPENVQLNISWNGFNGGDLTANVKVSSNESGHQELANVSGNGSTNINVPWRGKYKIVITPNVSVPNDLYIATTKNLKNTLPETSTGVPILSTAIRLKVNRENKKNVLKSWERKGVDATLAQNTVRTTLLGFKIRVNSLVEPKVIKTQAAFDLLPIAERTKIQDSLATMGGYNVRTQSGETGAFSFHSIGCAIDINENMDTYQNHDFGVSGSRLLDLVEAIVRLQPNQQAFDIGTSQGMAQLAASELFNSVFPKWLYDTIAALVPSEIGAAPAEAPSPRSYSVNLLEKALKAAKEKREILTEKLLQIVIDYQSTLSAWIEGTPKGMTRLYGMIPLPQKFLQLMLDNGWRWGGNYARNDKDYMHFEDEEATNIIIPLRTQQQQIVENLDYENFDEGWKVPLKPAILNRNVIKERVSPRHSVDAIRNAPSNNSVSNVADVDPDNDLMESLLESYQMEYTALNDNLIDLYESLPYKKSINIKRGDILIRRQYGHHKSAWYGIVESIEGNEALVFTPKGYHRIMVSKDKQRLDWELRLIQNQNKANEFQSNSFFEELDEIMFTEDAREITAYTNIDKELIINTISKYSQQLADWKNLTDQQVGKWHGKIEILMQQLLIMTVDSEYMQSIDEVNYQYTIDSSLKTAIERYKYAAPPSLDINQFEVRENKAKEFIEDFATELFLFEKPPVLQSVPLKAKAQGANVFINPKEDMISVNYTGRYEATLLPNKADLKSHLGISLHINQAGYWIEGILSFIQKPDNGNSFGPLFIRFYFSIEDIKTVRFFYRYGNLYPIYVGFPLKRMFEIDLSGGKDIELLFTSEKIRIPFSKISNKPFYTENHLDFSNKGIWLMEFFPLLREQKLNLYKFFITSDIDTYTPLAFASKTGYSWSKWGTAFNRQIKIKESIEEFEKTGKDEILDNVIAAIEQFIVENFHKSDYGKAAYFIKLLLNSDGFQNGNGSFSLSYLAWLYRFLLIKNKTISHLFETLPTEQPKNYTYSVKLNLSGLAGKLFFISAGGFTGSLEVVCDAWKDNFGTNTMTFNVYYGSLGGAVGLSVQTGLAVTGIGYSPILWQPTDFEGDFTLNKADFSLGVGPVSAGTYFGDMNINSPKGLPDLNIRLGDLSKIKFKVSGKKGMKLGGGVDVTLLGYGKISNLEDKIAPIKQKIPYGNHQTDYKTVYTGKEQVHFKNNGAELSKGAINLIRRMCAMELPLFQNNATQIRIEGYTDSKASKDYNLVLALKRSENVNRTIVAVMSNNLKAKVDVIPIGEALENSQGVDNTVNPKARRVDILINGVVVLSLW